MIGAKLATATPGERTDLVGNQTTISAAANVSYWLETDLSGGANNVRSFPNSRHALLISAFGGKADVLDGG